MLIREAGWGEEAPRGAANNESRLEARTAVLATMAPPCLTRGRVLLRTDRPDRALFHLQVFLPPMRVCEDFTMRAPIRAAAATPATAIRASPRHLTRPRSSSCNRLWQQLAGETPTKELRPSCVTISSESCVTGPGLCCTRALSVPIACKPRTALVARDCPQDGCVCVSCGGARDEPTRSAPRSASACLGSSPRARSAGCRCSGRRALVLRVPRHGRGRHRHFPRPSRHEGVYGQAMHANR